MPGTFSNIYNFGGTWVGSHDGRNARMSITIQPHIGAGSGAFAVIITFDVLDAFERYQNGGSFGSYHVENTDGSSHVLHDIVLWRAWGEGQAVLKRLYLHTWNIDYLSGISEWNGREFGLSFRRDDLSSVSAGMTVSLQCAGAGPEPNRFLDGRTADGSVGLAPSTDPPFSGTRWIVYQSS
jgi:hypothetical protein